MVMPRHRLTRLLRTASEGVALQVAEDMGVAVGYKSQLGYYK